MKSRPHCILVIDDEPSDKELIYRALISHAKGYQVEALNGGQATIDYLNGVGEYSDRLRYPLPCFVILDLHMPDVSGFTVLEYIQANSTRFDFPVVVFTNSASLEDAVRAYTLGAKSLHVKPSEVSELSKQIKVFFDYWMSAFLPSLKEKRE